jgi:hypothetical protein
MLWCVFLQEESSSHGKTVRSQNSGDDN